MKKKVQSIIADNLRHKWRSMWYKATTWFDMILLYLNTHDEKTTRNTTLQEFQAWLSQYIDEFTPLSPRNDRQSTTTDY